MKILLIPAALLLLAANYPGGDPILGRQAFINLQCNSCHRVAEDPALPAPKSDDAPVLRGYRDRDPEAVANSIKARTCLDPRRVNLDAMSLQTQSITEWQLHDIVAYLRDPAAARY